jgi:predicted nucleotidyltransferase
MNDRTIRNLPYPNEAALGLRLTDQEWTALIDFLSSEPEVKRAWVYGSRATGIRRKKERTAPPDIDVAIEPGWQSNENGTDIHMGAEFKARHAAEITRWKFDIDWHGFGHPSDQYHHLGIQVWPR